MLTSPVEKKALNYAQVTYVKDSSIPDIVPQKVIMTEEDSFKTDSSESVEIEIRDKNSSEIPPQHNQPYQEIV